MAQLAAHMPLAELVSPPKLMALHQVGAAPGLLSSGFQAAGLDHGPELHQGSVGDYCEPGIKAAPVRHSVYCYHYLLLDSSPTSYSKTLKWYGFLCTFILC